MFDMKHFLMLSKSSCWSVVNIVPNPLTLPAWMSHCHFCTNSYSTIPMSPGGTEHLYKKSTDCLHFSNEKPQYWITYGRLEHRLRRLGNPDINVPLPLHTWCENLDERLQTGPPVSKHCI